MDWLLDRKNGSRTRRAPALYDGGFVLYDLSPATWRALLPLARSVTARRQAGKLQVNWGWCARPKAGR